MSNLLPPSDSPPTAGYSSVDKQSPLVHRTLATVPPPIVGSTPTAQRSKGAVDGPAISVDERPPKPRWKGEFEPIVEHQPILDAAGQAVQPSVLKEKRDRWFSQGVPAWLVSLILHTVLIVVLVLIQIHAGRSATGVLVIRLDDSSDPSVELLHLTSEPSDSDNRDDASNPLAFNEAKDAAPPTSVSINVTSPLEKPDEQGLRSSSLLGSLTSTTHSQSRSPLLPTGGLYARDPESRAALGARYGATAESEEAVEAALKWLALHQRPNGSWSFDLSLEPCNGRCSHSQKSLDDSPRPATAATGLALLAFLGAGYSHHDGIYADNVRRGLYFLREAAREAQFGLDLQSGSMYGHGIALLAISEAMAMTRYQGKQDSDLFSLTDGAATFTMVAQHERGGWRYIPGSPGDMTVTAWQVLSLISAQHGGVVLRTNTLSRAERFLRGLSNPNIYEFGYQTTTPKNSTTAIGLCLLLYLGQSPEHTLFQRSLDRMLERGPSRTDLYLDYYATLALHHARHPDWDTWHKPLRDHLVKSQSIEGHEAGSWHFEDLHGNVGGRLYSTAMAAMILEVYYRYLPLYKPREEFTLD